MQSAPPPFVFKSKNDCGASGILGPAGRQHPRPQKRFLCKASFRISVEEFLEEDVVDLPAPLVTTSAGDSSLPIQDFDPDLKQISVPIYFRDCDRLKTVKESIDEMYVNLLEDASNVIVTDDKMSCSLPFAERDSVRDIVLSCGGATWEQDEGGDDFDCRGQSGAPFANLDQEWMVFDISYEEISLHVTKRIEKEPWFPFGLPSIEADFLFPQPGFVQDCLFPGLSEVQLQYNLLIAPVLPPKPPPDRWPPLCERLSEQWSVCHFVTILDNTANISFPFKLDFFESPLQSITSRLEFTVLKLVDWVSFSSCMHNPDEQVFERTERVQWHSEKSFSARRRTKLCMSRDDVRIVLLLGVINKNSHPLFFPEELRITSPHLTYLGSKTSLPEEQRIISPHLTYLDTKSSLDSKRVILRWYFFSRMISSFRTFWMFMYHCVFEFTVMEGYKVCQREVESQIKYHSDAASFSCSEQHLISVSEDSKLKKSIGDLSVLVLPFVGMGRFRLCKEGYWSQVHYAVFCKVIGTSNRGWTLLITFALDSSSARNELKTVSTQLSARRNFSECSLGTSQWKDKQAEHIQRMKQKKEEEDLKTEDGVITRSPKRQKTEVEGVRINDAGEVNSSREVPFRVYQRRGEGSSFPTAEQKKMAVDSVMRKKFTNEESNQSSSGLVDGQAREEE